jgi:hypothetical protein
MGKGMGEPDEFQEQFIRLRDEYLTVRREPEPASRYNVFRFLKLKEIRHSAVLADLLNPQGNHGQGELFLRHFLGICPERFSDQKMTVYASDDSPSSAWKVLTEPVVLPYGRLDIVIKNPDLGILIVIENKRDADERPFQMRDYGDWMDGLCAHFPHQALVFLTPDGRESVTHGGARYDRLSYGQDVVNWLESAVQEVREPRLKETIIQYAQRLRKEPMDLPDEIRAFLRRPDNLSTALDVARQVKRLRNVVHAEFWSAVEHEMRHRLETSRYADQWEIQPPSNNFREAWVNCQFRPKSRLVDRNRPHATVSLEQHKPQSANRLHYGITWQVGKNHPMALQQYRDLHQYLRQHDLTPASQGWWIFITDIGCSPRSDNFLRRMVNDQDAFIREIVNLPWNLFENTVGLLTNLNLAVQEMDCGH